MLDSNDEKKIKASVEEFFEKMTVLVSKIDVDFSSEKSKQKVERNEKNSLEPAIVTDILDVNVQLDEPQILIGEKGQTLSEIQRLLRVLLNKKLNKLFYLNVDINEYKKKKAEYLKDMAKDLADDVVFNKQEKVLSPMPAYERRIIHMALADRHDVMTESKGEGRERYIVISPK